MKYLSATETDKMKKIRLKKGWLTQTTDGFLWFKDKPLAGRDCFMWKDFSFLETDLKDCLFEITKDFSCKGKIEFLNGKWINNSKEVPLKTALDFHDGAYIKKKPVELEAKNIKTNVVEADSVAELIDLLIKTNISDLARVIAEYVELAQIDEIVSNDLLDDCSEEELYSPGAFDSHFYSLQSEVYKYWEIRKELITNIERAYDESLRIFKTNMLDNFDI